MRNYDGVAGRGYDISEAIASTGIGGLEGRTSQKQQSRLGDFAQELVGQGITSKDDVLKAGKAKGFTLIELLVVISIMGVLMGIMLPALSAAKDAAKKTLCLSNVHNIGIASYSYAGDNRDAIPRDYDQSGPLVKELGRGIVDTGRFVKEGYITDLKTFFCPAASDKAPHFTSNTTNSFNAVDDDLPVNYLWRNGSNMLRDLSTGAPIPKSTLTIYSDNNYKLLMDSNYNLVSGLVNHFQSGFVQHASILSPDGHAVGVSDPNNDSVSGGDRDMIFKWADKQK